MATIPAMVPTTMRAVCHGFRSEEVDPVESDSPPEPALVSSEDEEFGSSAGVAVSVDSSEEEEVSVREIDSEDWSPESCAVATGAREVADRLAISAIERRFFFTRES